MWPLISFIGTLHFRHVICTPASHRRPDPRICDTLATERLQINMPDDNRIEKKILLRATRSRVWRAIANAEEFGVWFGVKLEGAFVEGAALRGKITYPGY